MFAHSALARAAVAVTGLVILICAAVVGGSLTRPPAALADEDRAPRAAAHAPAGLKLAGPKLTGLQFTGLQLPTI